MTVRLITCLVMVCCLLVPGLVGAAERATAPVEGVRMVDRPLEKSLIGKGGFKGFTEFKRRLIVKRPDQPDYAFEFHYVGTPEEKQRWHETFPKRPHYPAVVGLMGRGLGVGLGWPWYRNSSFDIVVGKTRLRWHEGQLEVLPDGFRLSWDTETFKATFRILARPGEPSLLGRLAVQWKEGTKPAASTVTFYAMPGHHQRWSKKKNDRWILTAKQKLNPELDTLVKLDPAEANWFFTFDPNGNEFGSAAVVFDGSVVKTWQVLAAKTGLVKSIMTLPAGTESFRFMLFSFPDNFRKPESAHEYLVENAARLTEALGKDGF